MKTYIEQIADLTEQLNQPGIDIAKQMILRGQIEKLKAEIEKTKAFLSGLFSDDDDNFYDGELN